MTHKEIFDDRALIIAALYRWFQSQEIDTASATAIMTAAVGHIVHEASKNNPAKIMEGVTRSAELILEIAVKGL
jgi:hypothetical protein